MALFEQTLNAREYGENMGGDFIWCLALFTIEGQNENVCR